MESTTELSHNESPKLNVSISHKLEEILKQKFPSSQFTYTIESASCKGDNYIGILYRVTVQLDNNKIFKLIVKITPDNPIRRKQFFAIETFKREAFVYETFFPILNEFQKSKGLKSHEIFDSIPLCYGINAKENSEAIFLEDLCEQGYHLFDRFKDIDVQHVRLVMQNYARLHACSFAIEDQQPQKLQKYRTIPEIFLAKKDDKNFVDYFDCCLKKSLETLNDVADDVYKQKFLKFLANKSVFNEYIKYAGAFTKDSYSVFCHGDCWNNNIIYKYNEQQQPISAILLDWQLLRYASPITDIMYFIFTSTSRSFRGQYFREMMDLYYECLSDHLEILGSDANKIFPKYIFEEKLKEFGVSGYYFSLILLPVSTVKPENAVDMNELSKKFEEGFAGEDLIHSSGDALYAKLMSGVMKDMVDFGFLDM